jgi:ribonuclease D
VTSPSVRLATVADVPDVLASLEGARRVAIDTEFHAERRFLPELYLVQLHVDGGPTWIVDPLRDDVLTRIGPALLAVPWVVHSGEQDLRVLFGALGSLPEVVLDTQIAAGLVSAHFPAPYAGLVQTWLGRSLDKGETLSDWSRRPLAPAQLSYAALDVELLLALWDRLEERLVEAGRRDVALAACAEARRIAFDPPDDADAYREIQAAAALQPNHLRVLQELATWRLERARATNQPVRAVLSDGALVDLSRRQPLSATALLANRRMPRALAKDAEELVVRIARAAQRPDWAIPPLVRRRTPEWRAVAWLQLWADAVGEARRFASTLALPRPLAESLVQRPPADREEVRSRLGWRDPLCGPGMLEALSGGTALRIRGGEVVLDPEPTAGEK